MKGDEKMNGCFDLHCKKVLFEIRDLLKDIRQQISHLIEQNRTERCLFPRGSEDFEDDEDD